MIQRCCPNKTRQDKIAGDFNQWDLSSALAEFCDMIEVTTPATRGDRHIDKIFTNWPDYIEDSGCIPPLETETVDGQKSASDHNIQYCCFVARGVRERVGLQDCYRYNSH